MIKKARAFINAFNKLTPPAKFTPHIYNGGGSGCGACVLSLLTGIHPDQITPNKKEWSNKFVVRYLEKRRFKVLKLTDELLYGEELTYTISKKHVILATMKTLARENTWIVTHNDILYHNFEMLALKGHEFINHRLISAYALWHPSWGLYSYE
jgi:hypothetical protein